MIYQGESDLEQRLAVLETAVAQHVATIAERDATIAERDTTIAKLEKRVAELERKLGQNSASKRCQARGGFGVSPGGEPPPVNEGRQGGLIGAPKR